MPEVDGPSKAEVCENCLPTGRLPADGGHPVGVAVKAPGLKCCHTLGCRIDSHKNEALGERPETSEEAPMRQHCTLSPSIRRAIMRVRTGRPVTYTGRITIVDPAATGHRDQVDPFLREPVAVIDGVWAQSAGHATPAHAETWARDLLERACGNQLTLRWVVTVDRGDATPAGVRDRDSRAGGPDSRGPR
jgi:hypothetical protein